MEIQIESKDIVRLENTFRDLKYADKKKIINTAFYKALAPTVRLAKANVNTRTGNLRRSIGIQVLRNEVAALVGARRWGGYRGFHGHLVEYGTYQRKYTTKKGKIHRTGRMSPGKPYAFWLKHATDATGESAKNIMADEWYKAINKHLEKKGLKR